MLQRPATFAEAGVAAPFTTPPIAQARLRLDHRGRVEVVARNPTGADGNYVMPLGALREMFRLSIHDRALLEKIETLRPISPWTIRGVAQSIAIEGLCGPEAKEAAEQAVEADEERALLSMLLLLEQLLQEAGLARIDWKAINTTDSQVRERLRPHFRSLEPSISMSTEELIEIIDALSAIVAPLGFPNAPFKSHSETTLAELRELKQSVEAWRQAERDEAAAAAELVVECAALSIECAMKSMEKAAGLLRTTGKVLEAYAADRERVEEILTRPVWLLDGWRHLIALWGTSEGKPRDERREVAFELSALVPLVPLSADDWLGIKADQQRSAGELRRWVRMNEDWRSGLMIERQAAIEQLQAVAL